MTGGPRVIDILLKAMLKYKIMLKQLGAITATLLWVTTFAMAQS